MFKSLAEFHRTLSGSYTGFGLLWTGSTPHRRININVILFHPMLIHIPHGGRTWRTFTTPGYHPNRGGIPVNSMWFISSPVSNGKVIYTHGSHRCRPRTTGYFVPFLWMWCWIRKSAIWYPVSGNVFGLSVLALEQSTASLQAHHVKRGVWAVFDSLKSRRGHARSAVSTPGESFWALPILTIRELKQVLFGNLLLQFALVICCCQLLAKNLAILEHPAAASRRHGILPVSIWRLQCMELLCRHSAARMHSIHQGHFGAIAPKPTTLLVICPSPLQQTVALLLETCRSQIGLPAALTMGRSEDGIGYRTAPLKRYPSALCHALARVIFAVSEIAPKSHDCSVDDISPLAVHLETLYQRSEQTVDGADFHLRPEL